MKMFVVTRNCCTSGNCGKCSGVTPFGKCLRVQQIRTLNEEQAKRCQRNFDRAGYEARMFETEISNESEIHNYPEPVAAE